MAYQPQALSSVSELGSRSGVYPARKAVRWQVLMLSILVILGSMGNLAYGLWQAYGQFQRYGPAVLTGILFWPVVLFIIGSVAGSCLLWVASRRVNRVAAVFQHGFACRDRLGTHAWRWADVASLRSVITRNYLAGIYTGTRRIYKLEHINGSRLVLDDSLIRVEHLVQVIERNTFPIRCQRAMDDFNAGRTLLFGPLALSRTKIQVNKRTVRWRDVQQVSISRGKLRFIQQKSSVALLAADIPNLDVLLAILGQRIQVKTE